MAQVGLAETNRNMPLLITPDGYCYIRNREAKDLATEYWRCELRTLPSLLLTH